MTALYIISGIVLLFALVLSLKIKLFISLDRDFRIFAGVGPVIFAVLPQKKKKVNLSSFTYKKHKKRLAKDNLKKAKSDAKKAERERKKQEAKTLAGKAAKVAAEIDESKSEDKISAIFDIIKFGLDEIPHFASHIRVDIKRFHITVGGNEAADIAVKFGVISTVADNLLLLLREETSLRNIRPENVSVKADFLSEKTTYDLDIRLSLSIFAIVLVFLHLLRWFVAKKIKSMNIK